MAYIMLRHNKVKTKAHLTGLQHENNRQADHYNNEVDTDRTHNNVYLRRCDDFANAVNNEIVNGGFDLKHNKILALDTVYVVSPEWFRDHPKDTHIDMFTDCLQYHERHFGKVISAVIHYDETTPHLHIVSVPIINVPQKDNYYINTETGKEVKAKSDEYNRLRDAEKATGKKILQRKQRPARDKDGKIIMRKSYNGSAAHGNGKQLSQAQTMLYNEVGKKYGLERGAERVDSQERKERTTAQQWRAQKIQEKIDQLKQTAIKGKQVVTTLQQQAIDAKEQRDKMQAENDRTAAKNAELLKQQSEISGKMDALQVQYNAVTAALAETEKKKKENTKIIAEQQKDIAHNYDVIDQQYDDYEHNQKILAQQEKQINPNVQDILERAADRWDGNR